MRSKPGVDLGDEPPLTLGEHGPGHFSQRDVSIRWLVGTVATAITSITLLGGALFVALDGRYVVQARASSSPFATLPSDQPGVVARKGDLVKPESEPVSDRKVIEVSTVTRSDGEDLIKLRPYALVTLSLVLDKNALDPDIPAFDPADMFARDEPRARVATDAIYGKSVDGEVKISVADFPLDAAAELDRSVAPTDEEVERELREQLWFAGTEETRLASTGGAWPGAISAALPGADAVPGASITFVPANVSEIAKTVDEPAAEQREDEFVEVVQPGDTLSKIMLGSGVAAGDMRGIDRVLRRDFAVDGLKAGQILVVRFGLAGKGESTRRRPVRLTIYENDEHLATVAQADDGTFVAAQPFSMVPPDIEEEAPLPARNAGSAPTIYQSLYQAALDHGLPKPVIEEILRAFAFDFDFNARARPGDVLRVVHSLPEAGEDDAAGPPEILYLLLRAGGVERRLYRYKTPDDNKVDYYDESGRSAQKFLVRKPMARGVFRSGYGMRRHPILGYRKMHTGVDWAAPRGTPIYAAGDGEVVQAGWRSGYGRAVHLRHKYGYQTRYAHMSRIADGITRGAKVKQGQVIGYVGTTGLSTGPHLHFEILVNNHTVNPLKVRLPRGRELSGPMLAAFGEERARIDALIEKNSAGTQFASR